ncbi:MAG: family 43 glycosylhydrolase [Bacteroidales bacterium]|nr:family 43 glycosylhydrolase [Bacteroidales bacterium]
MRNDWVTKYRGLSCLALFLLLLSAAGCGSASRESVLTYSNPVIARNFPDPSVIDDRDASGWFYAYSTQSRIKGVRVTLPVYRSRDMVHWEFAGDGFAPGGEPQWSPGGGLWAPDVNRIDGRYVLYYAMGHWGDSVRSASGVAVSDSPTGPFRDCGMIVSAANTGVMNSIDPAFFEDKGKRYLFWGSFNKGSGIWAVELSPDGLSVKEGVTPVQISAIDTEGAYVVKRGRWYYVFASRGSCCEGARSTYHMVVARSRKVLGPYTDPSGKSFLDEDYGYTILSSSPDATFRGTGHNSALVRDDAGQDWLFYHSYWSGNDYRGRCLLMDRVEWKKGWPVIVDGQPSKSSQGPVIRR